MTERLLLLRTAATARYVILGTDYPCARVFDRTSSALVAVLQPSKRDNGLHMVTGISLTCVAVGSCTSKPKRGSNSNTALLESFYAAAGLSNGTVILHHIDSNESLGEVLVSPTQMPVQSLAVCDGFLWCLSADGKVSLVNLGHPEDGVCFQFAVQSNASALTVTRRVSSDAVSGDQSAEYIFDVLVVGSTTSLFAVTVHSAAIRRKAGMDAQGSGLFRMIKGISFASSSQGSSVSFAWISPTKRRENGQAAVTASATESTIRVWDVQSAQEQASIGARSTEGSASQLARCRRTLVCGQRIADVSVLESDAGCFISATTFTGAVLIWDLGTSLLPRIAESLPLSPDIILYSAVPVGRLLLCQLLPPSGRDSRSAAEDEHPHDFRVRDHLSVLLVRGRFALPCFEQVTLGKLPSQLSSVSRPQQHRTKLALLSSLAITSSSVVTLKEVPLSAALRESLELQDSVLRKASSRRSGEDGAFDALDNVWAKQNIVAVATRANLTPTEAFPLAKAYRAQSTAELPIKSMTLEQRIRQVTQEQDGLVSGESEAVLPAPQSLGLATVPLYQALHANDGAAVMELLSVAARTPEGMRATVMSLELPYCLQLLGIISERLGICSRHTASGAHSATATVVGGGLGAVSSRSPLLQWVDAIVHYRGMEMYESQRSFDSREGGSSLDAETTSMSVSSPPKDFIAPILHQYRRMTKMYDSLATLHGRIGAFLGVRPSEKNRFVNRSRKMLSSNLDIGADESISASSGVLQSDIVFPAMFAEVASRKKGNYTIRVRNKAAAALSRRKKLTRDQELLRQAKRRAAEEMRQKRRGEGLLDNEEEDVWDEVMMEQMAAGGEEGLMDQLQEMEALDLDSNDEAEAEEGEEEFSSEEEESESGLDEDDILMTGDGKRAGRRQKQTTGSKRHRVETDEVLAQDASDEDDESDSSAVEFSEGSDEPLDSEHESNAQEETSSSSDEEEDGSEMENDFDDDGNGNPSDEDDEDEDDGMGEDMQELLEQTGSTGVSHAREKQVPVD